MKGIKTVMWSTIIIGSVVLLLIIAMISYSVYLRISYSQKAPFLQKNSKWISEDKRIEFIISEDGQGTGTLQIDSNKKIDIIICGHVSVPQFTIWLNSGSEDYLRLEDQREQWEGIYFGENKFIVIVKETTYYEKDQKIVFYKVSEDVT